MYNEQSNYPPDLHGDKMPLSPEQHAREEINRQLLDAGWIIQNVDEIDITKGSGIAIRQSPLKQGHVAADYLRYGDGETFGVSHADSSPKTHSANWRVCFSGLGEQPTVNHWGEESGCNG
jgi:hypothetical protein